MALLKNKIFETSFVVMPQDTNYMPPMVFGGKVMAEMDIAAGMAVRRAIIDSPTAKDAVTTRVTDIEFHVGAKIGDLIFLKAEIIRTGFTSITIQVNGVRELKDGRRQKICNGIFTFVTVKFKDERKFEKVAHELEMGISGQ